MTDTLTRALQAPDMVLCEQWASANGFGQSQPGTWVRDAWKAGWTAALAAASAPGVPAGWRLVPVEATPEMIAHYLGANTDYWRAADEVPPQPGVWRSGTPMEATAAGYRAMLSASPPPPTEQSEQARQPLTDGWRPIESAPRDGSLFLCWVSAVRYGETDEGQQYQQDASQVDFCNWRTQADIPDCGWFEPCCGQIGDSQDITHWQPLPAPPIEPAKDAG